MNELGQIEGEPQGQRAELSLETRLVHNARLLWDIQKMRIAIGNRRDALRRSGAKETNAHDATLEVFLKQERFVEMTLQKLAKQHIMADWIEACPGLGYGGFARIVGVTGSFLNFPNVAKVWKYIGLHVVNSKRPRRERGVQMVRTTEGEEGNAFSPQGQVVAHQIGEAIVKLGRGPYRIVYDERRAKTFARPRLGPSGCPMGQEHKKGGRVYPCVSQNGDGKETSAHLHNDAMRVAVKALIKDMWVEWTRRVNGPVKSDNLLPAVSVST